MNRFFARLFEPDPPPKWRYKSTTVEPNEVIGDVLRKEGEKGWEAWFLHKGANGFFEVFFKKPVSDA